MEHNGDLLVTSGTDGRVWLVSTASSSLVLGWDDTFGVTQRYWGARIEPEDLSAFREVDRHRWDGGFHVPTQFERAFSTNDGSSSGAPALDVLDADGIHHLAPQFVDSDLERNEDSLLLTLRLRDPRVPLSICLHVRITRGTDVVARWTSLEHVGSYGELVVTRMDSAVWPIPDGLDQRLSATTGAWGAETLLTRAPIAYGETMLGSRSGLTGHEHSPWVMVDDGTCGETTGVVHSVSLAWSGSWHIVVGRHFNGGTHVAAGWGNEVVRLLLSPGDRLTSPESLGLRSDDGFGGASRAWQEYARSISPGDPDPEPVIFNSWEATGFEIDERNQSRLAADAARIGAEIFVVDDGWFGARTSDRAGLGDWTAARERFPNGLGALARTVANLGMRFGIWVEPEMVNRDSDLFRAHPDWVQRWPGVEPSERRNQLVLQFGRTEVQDWAFNWLSALVDDADVSMLKWDMNRPFTDAGDPRCIERSDHVGIAHVRGVYAVMDRLRARHPRLRIEACAGGGGRVDFEMLKHADHVWTSDNTDALDRQRIQDGFSQVFPATAMGAWATDPVNHLSGRTVPLDYRFHVAMAGALGIGGDLRSWSETELDRAAHWIEIYKRIRTTVQRGAAYRLGGPPGRAASAIQYVGRDEVVVFMYEPHRSLSDAPRRVRLMGLDPDASYADEAGGAPVSGRLLMQHGLLFNAEQTLRGWNNTRFSAADYASSVTILHRAMA